MSGRTMRARERGFVLGAVAVSSIVFSIAAFTALTVALSGRRQSTQFHEQRLSARYAAEAGLVWAMQQLQADPSFSSPAGNVDVTVGGLEVDVVVPPCAQDPCEGRTVQAKVRY